MPWPKHGERVVVGAAGRLILADGALILCVDVLDRIGASAAGEQIAAAPDVLADLEARFQRPPLSGIRGLADDPVWAYVPERLNL